MKKRTLFPIIILILVGVAIHYKAFFFNHIPFPGDLLIAESAPWKYESYLGYNPGSYPHKAQYADVIRQIIPWRILAVENIKQGTIPLWNPYNFSGAPLLANNQSSVLYPVNLIFFILPYSSGWTLYITLQTFLMLIFTYLYARELKLSQVGSIFSSIAFSLSLFVSVFFEYGIFGHTILWLPLVLLSIEKYFSKRGILWFALIAFGIFSSALAGHLQIFLGVLGFSCIYSVVRAYREIKILSRLLFALLLGIGMSSIQLLPTLELIINSARVSHEAGNYFKNILNQIWHLIFFYSPDALGNPVSRNYILTDSYPGNAFFTGGITLVLAVFAFLKKRNIHVLLYGFTIIFMFIILTNNPLTKILYYLKVPFISTSSPSNIMFLISFSLAILAGFGITFFEKRPDKKIILSALSVFLGLIVSVLLVRAFGYSVYIKQILFNSFILVICCMVLAIFFLTKKRILLAILVGILFVELFYYFHKFNPFVEEELFYPRAGVIEFLEDNISYGRVWGYGPAHIDSNYSSMLKLYSPEGYDPLYPKWYGEYISLSKDGKQDGQEFERRSDAVIHPGSGEKDLQDNTSRQRVLNELGVEFILDRVENGSTGYTFEPSQFEEVYSENGWKVFENRNVWPRAYFTSEFCEEGGEIFIVGGINGSCRESGSASLIPAKIARYEGNRISASIEATGSGIFVLTDTFYPGWIAYDNDIAVPIVRVDGAFRGIRINEGIHKFEFVYQPKSFSFGLIITIISTVLVTGYVGFGIKNESTDK